MHSFIYIVIRKCLFCIDRVLGAEDASLPNEIKKLKEKWWVIFIQPYIGTDMHVCIKTHIYMHVFVLNMW